RSLLWIRWWQRHHPARRLFGLEILPLIGRHIVERGRFTELQRANVSDDPPAVVGCHARSVARHGAEAISDNVEKVADRSLFQPVDVIRRRLAESALHHQSRSVAQPAVARRAVNVEALLPAR